MNRRHVNYWLVIDAIETIAVDEVVTDTPILVNADDEDCVKRAMRECVVPSVMLWSPEKRDRLKLSLAYFLRTNPYFVAETAFTYMQDRYMPDPKDGRTFLIWLWECLYPGESYEDVDITDVVEINDVFRTYPPHMG